MTALLASLAKVVAGKIVSGGVALAAAIGIVVPLGESQTVAAALTLALAAALQTAGQLAAAWAEQHIKWVADIRPIVIRFLVRQPGPAPTQAQARYR